MKFCYKDELELARKIADKVGDLQLAIFSGKGDFGISFKSDKSPVTQIDKESEKYICDAIRYAYPEDSFFGEESGNIEGQSTRCWIVDPLDGTRPFIRGIPTFSILICLEDSGIPVVGVAHFPGLKQTFWASKGGGAFCNGQEIHVSSVTRLNSAMGSICGVLECIDGYGKQCTDFMRQLDYCYGFMDAYSYCAVAAGKLDVCVSTVDKPYDRAAAAFIVVEAGGKYSDFSGKQSYCQESFLLSNGLLHQETLSHFAAHS